MNRRRFAVLAGLFAAAPAAVVRAQTVTTGECAIGFVGGLLQYSPDCALLTPPGLGMEIAPPSHLASAPVDEAAADTAAQEAETEAQERLTNRRGRKDDKKDRRRDNKRDKRGRGTERKQRKRDGRRERDEARKLRAEIDGCGDFDTPQEAQDYYLSVKYDRVNDPFSLDRDRNDVACDEMAPDPAPQTS